MVVSTKHLGIGFLMLFSLVPVGFHVLRRNRLGPRHSFTTGSRFKAASATFFGSKAAVHPRHQHHVASSATGRRRHHLHFCSQTDATWALLPRKAASFSVLLPGGQGNSSGSFVKRTPTAALLPKIQTLLSLLGGPNLGSIDKSQTPPANPTN